MILTFYKGYTKMFNFSMINLCSLFRSISEISDRIQQSIIVCEQWLINRYFIHLHSQMRLKLFCLVVALILSTTNCFNFCEVDTVDVRIFTTQKEIQQIPLQKYIRGYDLDFTSTNPNVVQVFEPFHLIDHEDVTIKSGYNIINVDGKNSNNRLWTRQGILFAEGGSKNVSVGYGQFSSGVLPKIEGFNYLQLPVPSNCYSGLIYNENLDVVIDCEKIAQKQQDRGDLTCIIARSGKLTCKNFGSITKTSKRRSVVYGLGQQRFLMSAALTDNVPIGFQNQTFINIYHIHDDGVTFNLIVDRRTLGLQALSITDIDIVLIDGLNYVVLSDAGHGLVIFRYTEDNDIEDIMVVAVEGSTRQFAMTAQGTWLIATDKQVLDCQFVRSSSTLNILKKYEVDPTDPQIIDLQSSYMFLVVRTALNRLYTYDRKFTQLKYLLNKEQITAETAVVVSPFYPRLFQINNTQMVSIAISSGYLFVSQVDKSTDVQIRGYSGTVSCIFNVRVELVQSDTKIYQKKKMTSSYRLQSGVPASFLLSDYFGGSNLEYKVTNASPDIQYDIEHINKYTQQMTLNEQTVLFTKIVEIDKYSYWQATFTDAAAHFYKCQLNGKGVITCKENPAQKIDPRGLTFKTVDAIMRSNGQAVISWSYQNSPRLDYKKFGKGGCLSIYRGNTNRYSQILVGEVYTVFVEKQFSTVSFFYEKDLKIQSFTKNDFSQAQLASMGGGFYPRQIMDSHTNSHIFYLKFPIAIVTVSYTGGRQFEVLSYTPVSKTYIADDEWSIVVGKHTILLFTPNQIAEYAVLADASIQLLHKISLNKQAIFPVKYEIDTDTAYFQCSDGTIQYIRLNQPSLDSQYYSLSLAKLSEKSAPGASNWDVSGSWLVTQTGQAYYQYEQPILVISTNVPDSSYREELSMSLSVMSDNERKDVIANVTAFNYPAKIQASSTTDNGLVLPQKAEDQLIPVPLDKYFTGAVTNYSLVCPYCGGGDGNIYLVPPIRQIAVNDHLSNFSAIVGLEDNSGALVIQQNVLYLVNFSNIVQISKNIETTSPCQLMGANEGIVVVYCGGTNQELFTYQIQKGTTRSITLLHHYLVPAEAGLLKPSQIGLYKRGQTVTVFIHDGDLLNPGAKNSNIKVFELSNAIQFKGIIDSSTFRLPNTQPLNSMSIHNRVMLVTIGDKGIGYMSMINYETSAQFISLQDQEGLRNYTLDNTQYLRVVINQQTLQVGRVQALVTTSNSLNYLIQLEVDEAGTVTFKRVVEKYNRYGHQTSLNWALIDEEFVMIGYYNKTSSVSTLALYKRSAQKLVDFYTSHQSIIPETSLKIPKAALLHSQTISQKTSFLYLDEGAKPSSSGALVLFNVTQQFHLMAKYEKPGTFVLIKVVASNDYYSVSRDLSVEFEGGSGGGVKWYAIVIVVVLVAIAVGVAFGLYLKMKRKKADSKKVSLFTENEEVDEEV